MKRNAIPISQSAMNRICFRKRLCQDVNRMRKYIDATIYWMSRKRSHLENRILESSGYFKKLLEEVKHEVSVRRRKPVKPAKTEVQNMRIAVESRFHGMDRKRPTVTSYESSKDRPVRKTKQAIAQYDVGIPKGKYDIRDHSIPDTGDQDKLFQTCLMGLVICLVGLIICGAIYLIIVWAMR
jgi:hypothetical protein